MSEAIETAPVKAHNPRPPAAGIGRKPGVPNKIHTDVKKLAQSFGPDAIRKLAEMGGLIPGVKPATPNATQAYALDKLLDRAYGKAPQAHSLEGDGELLGVVLIPAKRPVGSRDLSPAPAPMIEGSIVDADAVEVGEPGVPNKIHTDVKKLAQSFGPDAIRKLAEMGGLIPGVKPATPNATQAYALDKLLDRAYGKAPQAHSLEGDGELLGVVLIPAKRPVGSRDLSPAPAPMIEGSIVDADAVEVGEPE